MTGISIVGAGVVGTAIASLLKERGYILNGIAGRNKKSLNDIAKLLGCPYTVNAETITLQSEIIFITTTDGAIAQVVEELAVKGGFCEGQTVIHMSGALPASIMIQATVKGARVLSLHPLQSFANVQMAINNLPGSYFTAEGDKEAYNVAEKIVKELSGQCFYIREDQKALYHAAACVASNYLVTLLDCSIRLLEEVGIPPEKGTEALLPLIQGTISNINNLGTTSALTGPIARGDTQTLERHLQELPTKNPDDINLYRQLGLNTVRLALNKGSIDEKNATEIKKLLKGELT